MLKRLPFLMLLAAFAAAFAMSGCGGGDDEDKGDPAPPPPPPPPPPAYEMQVTAVPGNEAQVGRVFSISLAFFEPGTTTPYNLGADKFIYASVQSGPGTLGGTTGHYGNDTSTMAFDDLTVSAQGSYVIQFEGTNSTGIVATAAFDVGPQINLRFTSLPVQAIRDRVFSVIVQAIDPFTNSPIVPPGPLDVTLIRDPSLGTATLGGTTTATISGASSVTFTNLTYPATEFLRLRASAPGCPDIISNQFLVDSLAMSFAPTPGNILVNGNFGLTINIRGQATGQPMAPNPPITVNLVVATGTGLLQGTVSQVSSGAMVQFTNLRYTQTGLAAFTAQTTEAPSVMTNNIIFGVSMTATAVGNTEALPNGQFDPFEFRARDGQGLPWSGPVGPLNWEVRNTSSTVVQNGQAAFTSGVATVVPNPMGTPGSYSLIGNLVNPNAASANIPISIAAFVPINLPGPFVALKTVRVGTPYTDNPSFAAPSTVQGYSMYAGMMPPGLTLNGTTGEISGTPTIAGSYAFTLAALLPAAEAQPIRCALAVFTPQESEIVGSQSFFNPGPFTPVGPLNFDYTFTSSYDNVAYPTGAFPNRIQVYHPNWSALPAPPSPAPVYIHHRGRGFNMIDYDDLGAHLASWGYIFITIEDFQSFWDGGHSGQSPISNYDSGTAERGMQSGSAFHEGVLEWVTAANSTPSHVLQNRVDVDKVFMGGHSRGGGATHGSHVRAQPWMFNGTQRRNINIRGVIYYMAFDLRFFGSTAAGSSTVYPIATQQPRLPSLVIAAENDGDLVYPYCDQFIDRSNGPTTFCTIYGGVHAFLSDAGTFDAGLATITRLQQQQRMFHFMVAFMKRWGELDISLEGLLYNNEFKGSSIVGVTAWRNMMETVMVDNHQGGNQAINTLGGANSITGGSNSTAASIYPSLGQLPAMGLRHNVITVGASANVTYTSNIPAAFANQQRAKSLWFRCGTVDVAEANRGYDWCTVRVRLVSAGNVTATVTIFDRASQNNNYLPDYTGLPNVFDRFVDASIPFTDFLTANPSLDLTTLQRIELVLESGTTISRQFYFDDLRFE